MNLSLEKHIASVHGKDLLDNVVKHDKFCEVPDAASVPSTRTRKAGRDQTCSALTRVTLRREKKKKTSYSSWQFYFKSRGLSGELFTYFILWFITFSEFHKKASIPDHTRLAAVPSSASKPDYLRVDLLKTPALTSLGSSRSTGLGLSRSNIKSLIDPPRQLTIPLNRHISTRPDCGWDFFTRKIR